MRRGGGGEEAPPYRHLLPFTHHPLGQNQAANVFPGGEVEQVIGSSSRILKVGCDCPKSDPDTPIMPQTLCELNLPATPAQIRDAQALLDRPIPPVLQQLYARQDGFQQYALVGDTSTLLMLFFSVNVNNHQTRWMLSDACRQDWRALFADTACPLFSENDGFINTICELFAIEDDEELPQPVQELLDHHLCIADNWEGNAGTFYTVDTRGDGRTVHRVPKPRFLTEGEFLRELAALQPLSLRELLTQMGAPLSLIDDEP